ncbi:MAG TPA: hypothetical protein VGF44_00830 [Terriglobales bacterium]|jgi:hypothetical protein
MAKKNEPSLTGHLLTTIARTVGVTAGMIVNKTTALTEVAVQAAGSTIHAASKKKLAPKKQRPATKAKKSSSSSKKKGSKKKISAKKKGPAKKKS